MLNIKYTLIVFQTTLIIGCNSPDDKMPADMSGPVDKSSDIFTEDMISIDMVVQDLNQNEMMMDQCNDTSDCVRGKVCGSKNLCEVLYGCLFLEEDEGCLIGRDGSEILTKKECTLNTDCDQSEYGPYCVKKVCHRYILCTQDDQCPSMECKEDGICKEL